MKGAPDLPRSVPHPHPHLPSHEHPDQKDRLRDPRNRTSDVSHPLFSQQSESLQKERSHRKSPLYRLRYSVLLCRSHRHKRLRYPLFYTLCRSEVRSHRGHNLSGRPLHPGFRSGPYPHRKPPVYKKSPDPRVHRRSHRKSLPPRLLPCIHRAPWSPRLPNNRQNAHRQIRSHSPWNRVQSLSPHPFHNRFRKEQNHRPSLSR